MTTETAPEKTLEQLKQDIAIAATTGDDNNFNALIKEYNSRKGEVAKALAKAAAAEAEALAGEREKLAISLHKAVVKIPGLATDLTAMKATGFTFKLDTDEVTYKSVALAVPAIKAVRAGGNGGAGRTKDEYGMTLDEVFWKFATDEDKIKMAAATTNTQQWAIKNAVKKAALTAGLLAPAK